MLETFTGIATTIGFALAMVLIFCLAIFMLQLLGAFSERLINKYGPKYLPFCLAFCVGFFTRAEALGRFITHVKNYVRGSSC